MNLSKISFNLEIGKNAVKNLIKYDKSFTDIFFNVTQDNISINVFDLKETLFVLENCGVIEANYYPTEISKYCFAKSYKLISERELSSVKDFIFEYKKEVENDIKDCLGNIEMSLIGIFLMLEKNKKINRKEVGAHLLLMEKKGLIRSKYTNWNGLSLETLCLI